MVSLLGIVLLLGVAYAFSSNRQAVKLRTVGGALAIQVAIGAFVLYVPFGRDALETISSGVQQIIDYSNEGISFVFGGLVSNDGHAHEVERIRALVLVVGVLGQVVGRAVVAG